MLWMSLYSNIVCTSLLLHSSIVSVSLKLVFFIRETYFSNLKNITKVTEIHHSKFYRINARNYFYIQFSLCSFLWVILSLYMYAYILIYNRYQRFWLYYIHIDVSAVVPVSSLNKASWFITKHLKENVIFIELKCFLSEQFCNYRKTSV